jgi:ankyrin repeat protein
LDYSTLSVVHSSHTISDWRYLSRESPAGAFSESVRSLFKGSRFQTYKTVVTHAPTASSLSPLEGLPRDLGSPATSIMWGTMKFAMNEEDSSNQNAGISTQHSNFGDAYSVKSKSSNVTNRFHDEPEADYDEGATALYRFIENKDWDAALNRASMAPEEAKTWVSRREHDSQKTRWRLLPLHAVCIFRAPLALMEALIEAYPEGPQMKDDQGMLPIHLACRNGASKGVVLTLLRGFPESLFVLDRKHRSLKDLIEASTSVNKEPVLEALKKFEKETRLGNFSARSDTPAGSRRVNEVDYENRTVLFKLILKKDWKAAAKRAAAFPDEASTWIVTKGFNGNLRFLPLHKACVLQPPENIIKVLLDAYVEGAQDKDQDGWLPVHCACFYGAGEDIINTLLIANPRGAQTKDDEGRIPLHYACLKGATQGVIDVLLATHSKGAMCKDDEGRLPVHHACSKGAPESVIDALLKASPKSAQIKDDHGRLPLHHACRKNATERVIRTLLRVYPRAAQIKDDQEKLAIHYSCQHGGSATVISFLLTTYPESINAKNAFGCTPLEEAMAVESPKQSEEVIQVLRKFKTKHDATQPVEHVGNAAKFSALESKIVALEKTLGKVALLGKEMKSAIKKKKDPTEVLDRFADDLIYLGSGKRGRASGTPLASKQTSSQGPVGLFGRVKSKATSTHA